MGKREERNNKDDNNGETAFRIYKDHVQIN